MNRRESLLFLAAATMFAACDGKQKKGYAPTFSSGDKKILRFGIHPYLNPIDMHKAYNPIMLYLQAQIKEYGFMLEASNDYAFFNKKLFAKEFPISLPNPYQTVEAIRRGYRVVAKMSPDSVFRGIFVARKDSRLKLVEQLKGKSVSFPAPTALAATMMPMYYLKSHGLDVLNDIKIRYVGSQYSSILNAYTKDTIAGATWPPPWEKWCKDNPQKAAEMEVVWQTEPLINNSVVVRDDIPKELGDKIGSILVSLSTSEEGRMMLRNAGFEGFAISSDKEYDVVKEFMGRFENSVGSMDEITKAGQ